jgi:hypothetical protein
MKRELEGKLDKANEVAAAAAAVAVKDILGCIDIERGMSLAVQRTESHEFVPGTNRPGDPMVPSQVVQQRQVLFELFQIFAHRAVSAPRPKGRGNPP